MTKLSSSFPSPGKASLKLGVQLLTVMARQEDEDLPEIRKLLAEGASLAVRDKSGMNALMWAIVRRDKDLALELVARSDIEAKDNHQHTALMYAARQGCDQVALYLIGKGARLDQKAATTGDTALMLASCSGSAPVVRALIAKGCSVEKRDYRGYDALKMTQDAAAADWRNSDYEPVITALQDRQLEITAWREAAAKLRLARRPDVRLKQNVTLLQQARPKSARPGGNTGISPRSP